MDLVLKMTKWVSCRAVAQKLEKCVDSCKQISAAYIYFGINLFMLVQKIWKSNFLFRSIKCVSGMTQMIIMRKCTH